MSAAYLWKRNGSTIAGASSSTLDLTSVAGLDRGDSITVEITPNDGTADGTTTTASKTIVNSPPTASVGITPDPPTTDQTLTATVTASDLEGDSITLTYVWTKSGSATPLKSDQR